MSGGTLVPGVLQVIALAAVILVRVPFFLGQSNSPLIWSVALAPLWIGLGLAVLSTGVSRVAGGLRRAWNSTGFRLLIMFLGLLFLGFGRSAWFGTIETVEALGHMALWGSIAAFGAVYRISRADDRLPLSHAAVLAVILYVMLNLGLHAVGVESQQDVFRDSGERRALMLSLFGIEALRVFFPMAAGLNAFGSVAGAAFVGSALLAKLRANSRLIRYTAIVLSLASLAAVILADSRGAFLMAVVVAGSLMAIPRRWIAHTKWVLPLLLIIPTGAMITLPILSDLGWLPSFSRDGGAVATLNGRTIMWETTVTELLPFRPVHLVGFGHEGHLTVGISEQYVQLFASYRDPLVQGPHNALLQYMVDTGLLGVLTFLSISYLGLLSLGKSARDKTELQTLPSLGVLTYVLLLGTIERVPTVYSHELFTVFILICLSATTTGFARVASLKG